MFANNLPGLPETRYFHEFSGIVVLSLCVRHTQAGQLIQTEQRGHAWHIKLGEEGERDRHWE